MCDQVHTCRNYRADGHRVVADLYCPGSTTVYRSAVVADCSGGYGAPSTNYRARMYAQEKNWANCPEYEI